MNPNEGPLREAMRQVSKSVPHSAEEMEKELGTPVEPGSYFLGLFRAAMLTAGYDPAEFIPLFTEELRELMDEVRNEYVDRREEQG